MDRVAVIGLGSISARHIRNLRQVYSGAHIYVMTSSGRLPDVIPDHCTLLQSSEEIIRNRVQMVIVASPAPFHAKHALPLIQAGSPVLIEKPVSTSICDAAAIANMSEQHRTPVAVAYCLRYLSSAISVQTVIKERTIGTLLNAAIEVGQFLPDWRPSRDYKNSVSASAALGGGALFELSHELDYARWLLGDLTPNYSILRDSGLLKLDNVEDIVDIMAVSEMGVVTTIHLDFLQQKPTRKCRLIGTEGVLNWNLLTNSVTCFNRSGERQLFSRPDWDKNQMYIDMILDFERMILGEPNRCVTIKDAMETVRLISMIKLQAQEKR